MSLSINQTPAKTVSTPEGVSLYTSMWTAVHNPIVFKLASTLFPVADLGNTITFVTVSESALGNAVLTWATNPDVPPSDLVPGLYVKVEGAIYSGEYQIINYGAAFNTLEINTPFISSDTGTIQRAYRNYVVDLKVFAGLPDAHKWKALKPEIEVETLQQIPNASNVAIFDIQEAVKQQVNTKNDLSQVCAPNDVNLWTGFRVSYQESYNTYEGVIGVSDLITAASDQGGNQRFTTTNDIGLNTGDYVQLQGFTDTRYNGGVFKVLSSSALLNVDLDIPYSGSIVLNGAETMEQFSISLATFESGYTEEGNQYYAVNAKLNPRSTYGANMAEYLNNSNKVNEVQFISGFEGKTTLEGYYDDISAIIDKSLTDSLTTTETLALEINEKDRNGSQLATQTLNIPNQEEGVYRLPFLRGIPPFIYQLSSAAIISHLSYVRPAEFQYSPLAVDSGNTPTIQIDGTVNSARGDNHKYDVSGQTAVRDREVLGGLCLSVGVGNAGSNWDFSGLGLTGTLTATVGYYETSGATVTLDKTLTGTDPEIDNTLKTFTPQQDYKYHNLTIFENGAVFGIYRLEQKFDEVLIDASGNGNHVSGTGVTTPTDLWTIANINFSYANGDNNGFGYSLALGSEVLDGVTLTIGEIIPAITASLDANGAILQYRGRCAIDGKLLNSPTITFDNKDNQLGVIGTPPIIINPTTFTLFHRFRLPSANIGQGIGSVTLQSIFYRMYATTTATFAYQVAEADGSPSPGFNPIAGVTTQASMLNRENTLFIVFDRNAGIGGAGLLQFYINNVLDLEVDYTAFNASIDRQTLGNFGLNSPALSQLQTVWDARFYNVAKTHSEREAIINGTDEILTSEILAWYPMCENAGAIFNEVTNGNTSLSLIGTLTNPFAITQQSLHYLQAKGGNISTGSGSIPIGGYIPAALDIDGNPTGLDVEGNPISLKSGFVIQDFGNSLQVNPNNAPLLRSGFGVDDTEELTFAQIVEDVTGTGVDRYVKGGDTAEDYILVNTNIASPEDITDIQNYENR